MKRLAFLLVLAAPLVAQQPEECRVTKSDISVEYAAKTYFFSNEACREQFLSDPERYSQLYDALAELEAAGKPVTPQPASLVPS